jgi:hypothetical protein
LPPYISRADAAVIFGGDEDHIYQGDIFQSLEVVAPRPPGGIFETAIFHAMVVSHDCEYTKIREQPRKPLLVAPLRELRVFSQRDEILAGEAFALMALPREDPLDDAYVVDLRLMQTIAVGWLQEATLWTSIDEELKETLQARIAKFFLRRERVE